MDGDARTRARIMEHWQASEQGDSAAEHAIYAEDGILDYPQSRERFRGRRSFRYAAVARSAGRADAGPVRMMPATSAVA